MPRTAREHGLSCLGLIIILGVMGLFYLIFGPNYFQNPFIVAFLIFLILFIICWLFGYIHPTKWAKKRKLKKEYSYIIEAPKNSTPVSLQEETADVNKFVCPHCGALQDQGTTFCTKCGQKIE